MFMQVLTPGRVENAAVVGDVHDEIRRNSMRRLRERRLGIRLLKHDISQCNAANQKRRSGDG